MYCLEGISKRFDEVEALTALDLEINDGEWLGIVGRNGSGKTTLLRMLVGLSSPTTGRVLFNGTEPSAEDWRAIRHSLGFMPERIAFFENLTGDRMLRYFARLKDVAEAEVSPLLERVGLGNAAKRKLGGYSKGMLQRLNFAQALLGNPRLLIVDEPIEGLDVQGVREFFEILKSDQDRTVVISSHRLSLFSRYMDRVCVLSNGSVKAIGTEDDLHKKLQLPVRVVLHPAVASNGEVVKALQALGSASIVSQNGRVIVKVSQQHKVQFLADLARLDAIVQDVRIEEPSLEEVLLETS
jgi:Cu-processing system ATP-binding protein